MNTKYLILVSVLICSMVGIYAQQDSANAVNKQLDIAMELYNSKDYKNSLGEFSKVIKLDAKNGKAFYYRGMAKMHLKQNGFCKDLEESVTLGYSTTADIYYYGCDTRKK